MKQTLLVNYSKLLLLLLFVLSQTILYAQPKERHEQIESLRIAFISNKLQLTPEEAQKFWPVYNKFSSEMDKVRKDMRGLIKDDMAAIDKVSEKEAENILNEMVDFKVKEAEIIKKYAVEFKKVLPASKVILLFKAENDFKIELLRKLKERRDRPEK